MQEKYAMLKVMKEVLTNAATYYSVTSAAKKSSVSVFAAKHVLDYLYKKGMLTLQKVGSTYQYKADTDNYLTRQWKIVFSLEALYKEQIVENILKTKETIFNIILYGSVSRGTDDELSDIDIIVIADTNSEGKKKIIAQAVAAGREINIIIYTPVEWRRKASRDKAFYEDVLLYSINLYGEKPAVVI